MAALLPEGLSQLAEEEVPPTQPWADDVRPLSRAMQAAGGARAMLADDYSRMLVSFVQIRTRA